MSGSFFVDILAEQRELVGGANRREHLEGSLLSYPSVPFTRVSTEGIVENIDSGEHSGIFSIWMKSIAFGGHATAES